MIRKIALIGPECTGKTSLSEYLARQFNGSWVPEYARTYVQNLNRKYTPNDIEHIANVQLQQIQNVSLLKQPVFFDTDLIISKIWFQVVYNYCPEWIDNAISKKHIDFYLLCNTDIPWEPDPVRENGGLMRERLFEMYKTELENYKLPFFIVSGTGNDRQNMAFDFVKNIIHQG